MLSIFPPSALMCRNSQKKRRKNKSFMLKISFMSRMCASFGLFRHCHKYFIAFHIMLRKTIFSHTHTHSVMMRTYATRIVFCVFFHLTAAISLLLRLRCSVKWKKFHFSFPLWLLPFSASLCSMSREWFPSGDTKWEIKKSFLTSTIADLHKMLWDKVWEILENKICLVRNWTWRFFWLKEIKKRIEGHTNYHYFKMFRIRTYWNHLVIFSITFTLRIIWKNLQFNHQKIFYCSEFSTPYCNIMLVTFSLSIKNSKLYAQNNKKRKKS